MNELLKLVDNWAKKLTIRILGFAGASQSTINSVAQAFADKESAVTEAQRTAVGRAKWLKYLIICLIVGTAAFTALKVKQLIIKK